jgi:hypothetical protein
MLRTHGPALQVGESADLRFSEDLEAPDVPDGQDCNRALAFIVRK